MKSKASYILKEHGIYSTDNEDLLKLLGRRGVFRE